jgi:cbb3-type cytochrome oxidase maturation protein
MKIMFMLIFFSILIAIGFLIAFIISLKKGQYDDLYTPSIRMLFDNGKKKQDDKKSEEP